MLLGNLSMLAGGLSAWHIVALLAIVLLLFGGKKLPELARGLARSMRIFRDEMHGIQRDIDVTDKPTQTPPTETKQERDIHADTKPAATEQDTKKQS